VFFQTFSKNFFGGVMTVSTVLDLVGGSALVVGVALLSVPAALITLGVLCLVVSWRLTR